MQGAEMNNYTVTITFEDNTTYVWSGYAETQYRAEVLAMREMRQTNDQTVIKLETQERP